MNKKELINHLAETTFTAGYGENRVAVTKVELTRIVESALNIIDQAVANGDTVRFDGRSFKLVTRAARSGRNPQTGATIQIPEKKYIMYKKRV